MTGFLFAYIKSMRPYTLFVTGTAGMIGILAVDGTRDPFKIGMILLLLFLAYGLNQVINDILGTKEDRINAPKRPSVSGELDRKKAVILTSIIFLIGAVASFLLNPFSLVVMIIGFSMNYIYEYLKGVPLLGNVWFGVMISLSTAYGAIATTDLGPAGFFDSTDLLLLMVLIAFIQSSLCYFTYFKDEKGDREARKNTVIVLLRRKSSLVLGAVLTLIPFVLLVIFQLMDVWSLEINGSFLILTGLSFLVYIVMISILFHGKIEKRKPLELDFQASVLFHCGLISLLSPQIGATLGLISFGSILLFFHLMYRNGFY